MSMPVSAGVPPWSRTLLVNTSPVAAKLPTHYGCSTQEELLERLDVDFRYVDGPKYVGPPPHVHSDGQCPNRQK